MSQAKNLADALPVGLIPGYLIDLFSKKAWGEHNDMGEMLKGAVTSVKSF